MWNIFKVKPVFNRDKEGLVEISHKIPRIGTHIIKLGNKYFRVKELG